MTSGFSRLVRFEDPSGDVHYGEAGLDWKKDLHGQTIPIYNVSDLYGGEISLSGETAQIAKILSPFSAVPVVIAIGLNYKSHAEEAGLPIPTNPVVFTKFGDVLAAPFQDIGVEAIAKELDYEGELCVIIGKDVKNLPENADPFDYILGYTVGNDVSSRYWQWTHMSGAQHGYAKSFDGFAPIGPVIASRAAVPNPDKLKLKTWVNGQLKQNNSTDNMIFGISAIIRHLSQGITLKKGTIIMTGTPDGVIACEKPQIWLKSGDVVEVEIESIGKIANKMVIASE